MDRSSTLPHVRLALILAALVCLSGCAGSVHRVYFDSDPQRRALALHLDEIVRDQEYRGSILGGALIVEQRGERIFERTFGNVIPGGDEVTADSLFDVSSITKVLAAVPVAMLVEQHWPEEFARVIELMSHRSGICDDANYPRKFDRLSIRDAISANGCFDAMAGDCYSNAAYVSLAVWLEEREGLRDAGESFGTYSPEGTRAVVSGSTVAGDWIRGRPFDPLADYFVQEGRTTPLHSGLFASANDVALFAEGLISDDYLRDYILPVTPEVSRCPDAPDGEVVFRTPCGIESPVQKPWARPDSPPGRYLVQTGYTGCLLWIDRRTETIVVFLTNASATDARDEWRVMAGEIVESVWRSFP